MYVIKLVKYKDLYVKYMCLVCAKWAFYVKRHYFPAIPLCVKIVLKRFQTNTTKNYFHWTRPEDDTLTRCFHGFNTVTTLNLKDNYHSFLRQNFNNVCPKEGWKCHAQHIIDLCYGNRCHFIYLFIFIIFFFKFFAFSSC